MDDQLEIESLGSWDDFDIVELNEFKEENPLRSIWYN